MPFIVVYIILTICAGLTILIVGFCSRNKKGW